MTQLTQDCSWDPMKIAVARSSYPANWYIEDDEPVAQSVEHEDHEVRMRSILRARARRMRLDVLVGCELAFRWDASEPGVGVDPDVYVVDEPPRDPDGNIRRIRTWEEGNSPPLLAIEIVSKSRPGKDYKDSPKKHNLLGTFELWVFDPQLSGYTDEQEPVLLQIFQRETNHHLVQAYAGAGPYRSDALDAWVMVKDGELVIANDREGNDSWPTLEEEAERRADAADKRADAADKRANDALARIAELEAMLANAPRP